MDWDTKNTCAKGYISEYDRGYQDGSKETAEKILKQATNYSDNFYIRVKEILSSLGLIKE